MSSNNSKMDSISFLANASLVVLCLLFSVVLISGCSKSSETGETRTSEFKPRFDPIVTGVAKSNSGVDASFIGTEHFACFAIDVAKLRKNKDLADVPWEALSDQLGVLLGPSNSDISKIERVWVLLDRGGMEGGAMGMMAPGGQGDSPAVFVLDYVDTINLDQLASANIEREKNLTTSTQLEGGPEAETAPKLKLVAKSVNTKRIVIGSPKSVDSMVAGSGDSRAILAGQVRKLKFTKDVEGALSIEPIRDMIESAFNTIARFGGEGMAKWKTLPQSLQGTSVFVSLTDSETFAMNIELDDESLALAIAEMANADNGGGGGMNPMAMIPGLGAMGGVGAAGGMPSPGGNNGRSKIMIEPTMMEPAQVVAQNIQEGDLFSISHSGSNVKIRLKRPEGMAELIKALVVDSRNQFLLAERVRKISVIAAAMKKYQEEHGCLPAAGVVAANDKGYPEQFNWRTGLLKYLDPDQYAKFDFSKSWDAAENLEVAKTIPDAFSMFGKQDGSVPKTRFQLVGGENGFASVCQKAGSDEKMLDVELVSDKAKYTALVIEDDEASGTSWIEPVGQVTPADAKLGNEFEKGVLMISADFKAKSVTRDDAKIKAVLTANADDEIARDDFIKVGE